MLSIIGLAAFVYGVVALITAKFRVSKGRYVRGRQARLCAAILLVPLPLGFLTSVVVAAVQMSQGTSEDAAAATAQTAFTAVLIVGALVSIFAALRVADRAYTLQGS